MNPFDQLGTLWAEHHTLITVLSIVLAGVAATSILAWVLRKVVRPVIALVTGAATTALGAAAAGFLTDVSSAARSWVSGG